MPATAAPSAAPDAAPAAAVAAASPATGAAPATGTKPSTFRPPNPAFDRVVQAVKDRANKTAGLPPASAPAAADGAASSDNAADADASGAAADATATESAAADTSTATADTAKSDATPPKKDKKVSPWKLVDEWKKTAAEFRTRAEASERELTVLKAGRPAEAVPKEIADRLTQAEARVKEYEDHLRFLDYQRHPEFVQKYQQPYEMAWKRATSELAEVAVTDPATGATRAATAEDMLALVNMPLGKAREYADQLFGAFADDAMAHRKEIKSLFDTQQGALKEARENGAKRDQQEREQAEKQRTELTKTITDAWTAANREAVTHVDYGKYFEPVEGDQQGNAALAKGFELADKAFSRSPHDPSLSPEERKEVVRMHAALRNRAAAFGRLRRWHEADQARIAELEKELEDYKKTEPSTAGARTASGSGARPSDPWDRVTEGIRKRAKRY